MRIIKLELDCQKTTCGDCEFRQYEMRFDHCLLFGARLKMQKLFGRITNKCYRCKRCREAAKEEK
jgi:hypothetical protein